MAEDIIKDIMEMDPSGLKQKLDAREDFLLVDCRSPEEWEAKHIPEARLVPLQEFDQLIPQLESEGVFSKSKLIVIHCRSGKTLLRACEHLANRGYSRLANLTGGIIFWQEQDYPVNSVA